MCLSDNHFQKNCKITVTRFWINKNKTEIIFYTFITNDIYENFEFRGNR